MSGVRPDRVLYTLSRHGLFHPAAGRAHEIDATPYVAVTLLRIRADLLAEIPAPAESR
jgi:hypothetical protein